MNKYIFSALFVSFVCSSVVIAGEKFTLRGDSWCPYNCDPKSDGKVGYMVEIAEKIFSVKGIKIEYQVLNWNRTKKEVTEGKIDAIVGASKPDGDFIYPKNELGLYENHFYILRENVWRYKNNSSLKDAKVGVINDYTYGENADKVIASGNPAIVKVSGDDALPNLIKMLELKRITALYENPVVFTYKVKSLKKEMIDFKEVGSFDRGFDPLYIGFSKKFAKGQEYANLLDEGLIQMRKSGELKKILDKYGLIDWVKTKK